MECEETAIQEIAKKNSEEKYSKIPEGYEKGKTKYIVITGSVISGVGKGTVSSTLAKLLQSRGMNIEPMKLEAYLNVDAGTLSPFRHGEVFVLDDGTETDLDLGSYERMLDKNLTKDNFVTSGRIYKQVIEKERAGEYLGRDVQFIPHVTGEIKLAVRKVAAKIKENIKEKRSLCASIPLNRVFGMHDVKNIYSLPYELKNQGFDTEVLKIIQLENKGDSIKQEKELETWAEKMKVSKDAPEITIGIAGKYVGGFDNYISILKSLEHCSFAINKNIKIKWVTVDEIENGNLPIQEALNEVGGLIVPGGFGERGIEGKIKCIRYCRENKIPFLGLCYGFQLAIVEFARNVCGLDGAHTTEINKKTIHPVIDLLPEQYALQNIGGNMRLGGHDVILKEGTKAEKIHNSHAIRRRFRHRYECNPSYIELFEKQGIVFSGRASNRKIMQILEIPEHPFFMATQFHPEFTSRPENPDPIFLEFTREASRM